MRLDYSDKMGAVRDSAVRDGAERKPKPVQKNRPRKEPIGIFGLLLVLLLPIVTFGAGVLTGWFLFKGNNEAPVAAAPKATQQEAAPVSAQPGAVPQETPLTFYKTLPSGGQAVIGSGLNPKISAPAPTRATQPAPVPPGQAAPAPAAAPAAAATIAPAAKPAEAKPASEVRYLVQIASYRDKKEAEAAQAKLSTKGVAAYLVESKVKDKGVWYRLRVGRHLSKDEAEQLSGKVGSGATVLPE